MGIHKTAVEAVRNRKGGGVSVTHQHIKQGNNMSGNEVKSTNIILLLLCST